MQDTKTLKSEIIALLDILSADSLKLLAEFAAFLQTKSGHLRKDESLTIQTEMTETRLEAVFEPKQGSPRVSSPHLVNPEQVADFKLEVIEETS